MDKTEYKYSIHFAQINHQSKKNNIYNFDSTILTLALSNSNPNVSSMYKQFWKILVVVLYSIRVSVSTAQNFSLDCNRFKS